MKIRVLQRKTVNSSVVQSRTGTEFCRVEFCRVVGTVDVSPSGGQPIHKACNSVPAFSQTTSENEIYACVYLPLKLSLKLIAELQIDNPP